jgi:hypothetical protein
MQPPTSSPPQWSADGQWWWNGWEWRPRSEITPALAPDSWMPPPVPSSLQIALTPSPGLRIFLLLVLGIAGFLTGGLSLFGVLGVGGGANSSGDIVFFGAIVLLFALVLLALAGVAIRARWARLAAIIAGIAISLTCVGLILGIPILVAAARAPDLSPSP